MASIEHFLHPNHRLVLEYHADGAEYLCNGCNTPGLHKGYRCSLCNFNLHEYCGTCPRTLSSFMHPHPLTMLIRTPEDTSRTRRFCNVCRDPVQRLIYRCDYCDFDVHPICTQLPEYVRHVCDPLHLLRLHSSSHGCCVVCGGPCTSWRYCCGVCGFDIHFQCVEAPCDPASLTQRAVRPSGVLPSELRSWTPPTYGGYGHGHFSGPPLPPWPPTYGDYGHGHGVSYGPVRPSGVPPSQLRSWTPPTYGRYGHGHFSGPLPPHAPPQWPPIYGDYGHGHGHGVSYGPPTPPPPSWPPGPPPHGGYDYTVSHAYSIPYNAHNYVYRPQGSGASSSGLKIGKTMAALVGSLGIGVLSNFICGMIT